MLGPIRKSRVTSTLVSGGEMKRLSGVLRMTVRKETYAFTKKNIFISHTGAVVAFWSQMKNVARYFIGACCLPAVRYFWPLTFSYFKLPYGKHPWHSHEMYVMKRPLGPYRYGWSCDGHQHDGCIGTSSSESGDHYNCIDCNFNLCQECWATKVFESSLNQMIS